MASNFVLGSGKSSMGTRPPHHSAARTGLVLLIRRTVRPRGYASAFKLPAAFQRAFLSSPEEKGRRWLRRWEQQWEQAVHSPG